MALVIDDDKPCEAAAALRQVYYALVAGERSQVVTFKAGATGVERSVTYHKADPSRLLQIIRGFEERCGKLQTGRPQRFAIRGGGI